jgi:hypothetical protein
MNQDELVDIRDRLPADVAGRLLSGEPVFFYAVGSGGCLSGGKEWFALTDRRVLMTTKDNQSRGTVDIPIEHVAAVSSFVEAGCLSGKRGAIVVTSSGGNASRAVVGGVEVADRGTALVQLVLSANRDES